MFLLLENDEKIHDLYSATMAGQFVHDHWDASANVPKKKCHITFCVNPHEFYIATEVSSLLASDRYRDLPNFQFSVQFNLKSLFLLHQGHERV